jgi:proton-dependent oligopeptide transporter, POT family
LSSTTTNDPQPPLDILAKIKLYLRLGPLFWVCNIIFLLDGAGYFGILNVLTLFLHDTVRLTDKHTGFAVSYFTGMVTVFSATLGTITDRLGVRRTLLISSIIALVGRGLLSTSPALPYSQWVAFGALTLMAMSAGSLQPAVYAGVKQATTPETSAIGFSLLYALMNGGIILVSTVSPYVRKTWSQSGVLWMCTMITFSYLAIQLFAFPKQHAIPTPPQAADSKKSSGTSKKALISMISPQFVFFIFILLGVRTIFAHQWLTVPSYITRAYSAEIAAKYEWISAINPFIILFGTPLVAALTSRVHVVTMMIIGTAISAGSTFLLSGHPNFYLLIIYMIVFSIGEAMWSSRFYEYVAETAPAAHVGAFMGFAMIPWFIAKFTTGLYSGYMLERFCPKVGPQATGTMWTIYGLIALTSPVGLLLARRWLQSEKPRAQASEA